MKPDNPFYPSAKEVADLNYLEHGNLVNRLIANRGLRLGIDASQIKTTLRMNDPDGGVDALSDIGSLTDPFLGTGLIVWQFKSDWLGEPKLKRELNKSGVQDAFKDGAGYTLVLGQDMAASGPHGRTAREMILERLARGAGCHGEVRLFTADSISLWISIDPAAQFEVLPEIHGYTRVDRVLEQDPKHSIEYVFDQERIAIADAIGEWLHDANALRNSVRIQGVAGVGKTRLALEAIRKAGLEGVTLYSPDLPRSTDLFDWVASNEGARAIVIIDECEESEASVNLEPRVNYCGGRLRLITIGPGVDRRDVYSLGVLDDDAMERVVNEAASGLPHAQVRWVVEKTRGFVKLASVVAQAIAKRGIQNLSEMPKDSETTDIVKKMLIPEEDGRRALQGIALLSRVGFKEGTELEGQAIAKFIGIDWNRMQSLLRPAIELGIVSIRGRYWYVSPELLGLWLAADFWRLDGHRLEELIGSLPTSESATSLYSRLGSLGDIPEAGEVLEQALGPQGPFSSIESLDNPRFAGLFAALARTAPRRAAETADRLVRQATETRLQVFDDGRRELIWALETMLSRRDSFQPAIRALRRLAEYENEAFSNNATGVWSDVFLTVLAETEVPYLERIDVLEETLRSTRPQTRRLGVIGLASALEGNESKLLQGTNSGIPRRPWRPQTYGDLREIRRRPLGLLKLVVNDPDETVRSEARTVLREALRHLATLGLTSEWIDVVDLFQAENEEERREFWSTIQLTLEFERADLDETQLQLLQALSNRFFGDSLSDRLRRHLGPGMPANIILSEDEWNEKLRGLAREAIDSQAALLMELPWLVSGEAEQIWPFAVEIGSLDRHHGLFEPILQAATGSRDSRLLSGYLVGRAQAGGDSEARWRESVLDGLAQHENSAAMAWSGTYLGPASDRGLQRILELAEKGWISSEELVVLRYGGWPFAASIDEFIRLLKQLQVAGTSNTMTSALSIVDALLGDDKITISTRNLAQNAAWDLLENPAGWSHEPMLEWTWNRVGERLVDLDSHRIASIIVRLHVDGKPAYHDMRLELLSRAAMKDPEQVWVTIGDALLNATTSQDLAWELRATGLLEKIPVHIVERWIREHGCEAARVVAYSLQIESLPFPELARSLLRHCPQETGPVLARILLSGVWTGFAEPYWSNKLEIASELARDPEPAVSDWAVGLLEPLRTQVRMASRDDAERGWA